MQNDSVIADPERGSDTISGYQVFALIALMALNMQDGFDILAISFAADAIAKSWEIDQAALGVVLSAGLFGMMIGAMALSLLADRFGRRAITVIGLVLSGVGMVLAAAAPSIDVLIVGRVVTGIGIGGILASLNTLVAEFAGPRYRGLAVSAFQLGFPLGAFVSGFVAFWLLDVGTWRHIFAFGAATSFLFVPIVLFFPESADYLARSGRPDALDRINAIRRKVNRPALDRLPDAPQRPGIVKSVAALFARQYVVRTALIWMAFFLLLITLYFMLSWTPKILADLGFSDADSNRGGRLINFAGLFGIVGVGVFSLLVRPSLVAGVYLAMLALMLVVLSVAPLSVGPTMVALAAVGFLINGSMVGLYATVPALYPTDIRATGTGWAIGLSRFGAVIGPALAGVLLEAGWTPQALFQAFAIPVLAASGVAFLLWREQVRTAT